MGSSTYLDIIGSMMIFGLLFASMLQLNANASQGNYAYNQNYILQRNMVVLTVLLETDLKHVGDGVFNQNGGIMKADTTDLIFKSVLVPGSGVVNKVEWKLEPAGSGTVYSAPNNTRILYIDRIVDGVTQRMNLGVTKFLLSYWSVYHPDSGITNTPIDTLSCTKCWKYWTCFSVYQT